MKPYSQQLYAYLNPLQRLGLSKRSIFFPLAVSVAVIVLSELYCYQIARNPLAVGTYIIFIHSALVLYFAFRDGIKGGMITVVAAISYYVYIIYTREYQGDQLKAGLETTAVLGLLYTFAGYIVGWLKEKIDVLLQQEKQAKHSAEEEQLRLQTILEQLPVGVVLVNIDGSMVGNKQIEKILGSKVKAKLETNPEYKSEIAVKDRQPVAAKQWPILRAFLYGETVTAEEMELLTKKKKRVFIRVNAAPILNKQKQIIAAVSTIDDISSEKELEKRKDDFVNMASHELKTPITSMKLYVEALLRKLSNNPDEKVLKILQSVKNQTQRLQDLVEDLLDVSRIQTGKLHFKREEFELRDLIEDTIDVVQPTTKKQPIKFISKAPGTVYGDRFRISQVLTNLITNAIKYSPEGKEITIQVEKEASKVIVSVRDRGIGVKKELQKKIFDRLYQVNHSKEKNFPGLGMGLYISKEIITRHKGQIWVESTEGKGSTFFFSLPIAKK